MSKNTCKFNLNVATRLMLLMNLPEQGSVIEMISKRNIRKKEDGRITWSSEAPSIEVEFTDNEINLLKSLIDKLDKSGLITDNILDFIEKILKD